VASHPTPSRVALRAKRADPPPPGEGKNEQPTLPAVCNRSATTRIVVAIGVAALVAGCGQNMEIQPKYTEYGRAPLFRSGVLREPPAGAVARDDPARDAEVRDRPKLTADLFARGRERFGIFCSPCHGATGDGNGMVVQR